LGALVDAGVVLVDADGSDDVGANGAVVVAAVVATSDETADAVTDALVVAEPLELVQAAAIRTTITSALVRLVTCMRTNLVLSRLADRPARTRYGD
jgi:hypothetical protein